MISSLWELTLNRAPLSKKMFARLSLAVHRVIVVDCELVWLARKRVGTLNFGIGHPMLDLRVFLPYKWGVVLRSRPFDLRVTRLLLEIQPWHWGGRVALTE